MHNVQKHITPIGNYEVPTGWSMKPYKRPYGGTPGPPVMYEKPSDPEEEGAGYGYSNAEHIQEKDVFFYHSDHLGSTSYITDKDGNATQFVSYKPYGEALVDEHATSYEMPWKFNGKELDSETGLYYYGARYYEPVLALWYGVDAMAEKYPNMGGSVYCAGNPVKLVDPDGNDWVESENGNIYWNDKATSQETASKGETYLGKNVLVGTHNRDENGNEPINSATFDLYSESNKEGVSATIKGNTIPSDITKYGTLAECLYSAKFGHRNAEKYKNELALRIYNLDGTDGLPTLNGNPSKANSDLLTGVLFHAGNPYQKSLLDSKGRPVWSHGCQTSGCGPGSSKLHNDFMQVVGRNFNGSYYLRAKPQSKQNSYILQVPSFTAPVDNTYVAPKIIPYKY